MVEEAIELAQSVGVDLGAVDIISAYVYSRPVGEVAQEHAGLLFTLLASANANGLDIEDALVDELARAETIPTGQTAAKQRMKNKAGITKYWSGGVGHD